ncbi:hypothetical protein [Spirosoma sp. KUDC1026]|uniref:hypothetical protein n=1 Tax=Spirosoma sp. KUDC1026 TaxID=2745947 RepID=UPI00159B9177|nr:hypothetical protein [Spirosoma sp. KUDC1026]QKZ14553.1 hypothetical protein HU175_18760 [Spirosoma sp. KUDC1026]
MIKSKYISDVLELLLDGDDNGKAAKSQIPFLSDINCEYTNGGGVFISFSHSAEIVAYRLAQDNIVLNGVTINSPELEIGADATVFLTNGIIDYLEIWSFDGNYPNHELTNYTLKQAWKDSLGRVINENK